jgi:hypothetical protein
MKKITTFVLGVLVLLHGVFAQSDPKPEAGGWFLATSMTSLDVSNRFVGSLAATNASNEPIYIRASVTRVSLKDGHRIRADDVEGVLKVFPAEFLLRSRETFRVRIFADASKLGNSNASYYIKLEDVSRVKLAIEGKQAGLVSGTLFAYEALVNVNPNATAELSSKDFSLKTLPSQKMALTNLSQQHIYLERGNACPEAATILVECDAIADFPKQSMLPGETLFFNSVAKPYLVMLAQPKLNARTRANRIALPVSR